MPHLARHGPHLARHGPHLARHGPHLARHGPHLARHGPHLARHGKSLVLCHFITTYIAKKAANTPKIFSRMICLSWTIPKLMCWIDVQWPNLSVGKFNYLRGSSLWWCDD